MMPLIKRRPRFVFPLPHQVKIDAIGMSYVRGTLLWRDLPVEFEFWHSIYQQFNVAVAKLSKVTALFEK